MESPPPHADAARLQQELADTLVREGFIRSAAVESAFRAVPRHLFVPHVPVDEAYRNEAINTKRTGGRVVSSSSQPAIMAAMLEMLDLQPGHRVLEIGAGTGYNAALMDAIVGAGGEVVAVDIDEDIVEAARRRLATAGADRVRVVRGDGGDGFAEAAPFDRIVLTVAATDLSPAWREQLTPNGRLLLPLRLGGILTQKIVLFAPVDDHLASVSVRGGWFIMLRGAHAQAQASMPLDAAGDLRIWADELPPIDPSAISRLMTGPSREYPTGVRVDRAQFVGGLVFWLGLHESSHCYLTAEASAVDAERRRWPLRRPAPLFGTVCLADGQGLALLAGPPVGPDDIPPADRTEPYDLSIRGYGSADHLVSRLTDRIRGWDAAGRRSGEGLLVRAYPALAEPESPTPARDSIGDLGPSAITIRKRLTRLVLDWP